MFWGGVIWDAADSKHQRDRCSGASAATVASISSTSSPSIGARWQARAAPAPHGADEAESDDEELDVSRTSSTYVRTGDPDLNPAPMHAHARLLTSEML